MTSYAELRELALNATRGPWHAAQEPDVDDEGMCYGVGYNGEVFVVTSDEDGYPDSELLFETNPADAEYIAAVDPQTVIGLLDEIERFRSGRGGAPETGGQP